MPRVSVVIPCYNRAGLVGETIRCLLRQTLPPNEIIVVDDGSTDNTVEVLKSFGSGLRLLQQRNMGPGSARNVGFAAATGDYIWFMDSDDLASHNKLEVQLSALERTGADIAICPWVKCHLDQNRAYPEAMVYHQRGLPDQIMRALACGWAPILQAAMFRRTIVQKVDGFSPRPDLIVVEDQHFWLKCLLHSARLVLTSDAVVIYRTGGDNKLTDAGFASERRLVNIARYLIEVRRLCLEIGLDPCSWFFFRLRLWTALRDLQTLQSPAAMEAADLLKSALGSRQIFASYSMAQRAVQWCGGIRQRLFGDRSPFDLRAGPLQPNQLFLLSELGYSL